MAVVFTKEVLPIDTPNSNSRIYPRDVVEKIVKDFHERDVALLGELDCPQTLEGANSINLDRISHQVSNLFVADDKLMATLRVMETPMGEIARELLESDVAMKPAMRGRGMVSDTNIISDYTLVTIDMVSDHSAKKTQEPAFDALTILDSMDKDGVL